MSKHFVFVVAFLFSTTTLFSFEANGYSAETPPSANASAQHEELLQAEPLPEAVAYLKGFYNVLFNSINKGIKTNHGNYVLFPLVDIINYEATNEINHEICKFRNNYVNDWLGKDIIKARDNLVSAYYDLKSGTPHDGIITDMTFNLKGNLGRETGSFYTADGNSVNTKFSAVRVYHTYSSLDIFSNNIGRTKSLFFLPKDEYNSSFRHYYFASPLDEFKEILINHKDYLFKGFDGEMAWQGVFEFPLTKFSGNIPSHNFKCNGIKVKNTINYSVSLGVSSYKTTVSSHKITLIHPVIRESSCVELRPLGSNYTDTVRFNEPFVIAKINRGCEDLPYPGIDSLTYIEWILVVENPSSFEINDDSETDEESDDESETDDDSGIINEIPATWA